MILSPPFRITVPTKKKDIWERYLESFDIKPSANKSMMIKDIYHPAPPPPPKPQELRRITYGKLDKSDMLLFFFAVFVFIIVCMCFNK